MSFDEKIKKATSIIMSSKYIVAFTGAGISTESGIPDFRGEHGIWKTYPPEEYASYWSFKENPEKFWRFYTDLENTLSFAKPNKAHLVLYELECTFKKLKAIITQNIDSLHTKAGNTKIFELHGTNRRSKCISCDKIFRKAKISTTNKLPRCSCGGYIKPDVILFGESLPELILEESIDEVKKADLLIIVGSSLLVYPAADIPSIAKHHGSKVLIINKTPTMLDHIADLVVNGEAGLILSEIISMLT